MSSLSLKMSLLQNPHFYIVLVLFALKSISGSDLNETNSNQRDSRQLFTLLKNILKVQQPAAAATGGQEETPYYATSQYPGGGGIEQKIHSANINPEFQHQYPMLNYQTQQHSSVPLYNNLQQREELLPTTNNGQSSTNLLNSPINSGGGGVGGLLSMISKLGAPEDVDLSSIINFGSIEGMIGRVNRFDKLQCIPRMICQMVAKRIEDGLTTTTTTTTTTEKSVKQKKQRGGRFIKIDGMDGALDQFVKWVFFKKNINANKIVKKFFADSLT